MRQSNNFQIPISHNECYYQSSYKHLQTFLSFVFLPHQSQSFLLPLLFLAPLYPGRETPLKQSKTFISKVLFILMQNVQLQYNSNNLKTIRAKVLNKYDVY